MAVRDPAADEMTRKTGFSQTGKLIALFIILLVSAVVSLGVGRYYISPLDVLGVIGKKLFGVGGDYPDLYTNIVIHVRAPRILADIMTGGALALAGTVYQGLFKNPLVSPSILGVTSGAGFGAALAMLAGLNLLFVQASALVFAILAVLMSYLISFAYKQQMSLILVLAGVIVSSFFSSLISLIKFMADPLETLPAIVFWLMGSLSMATFDQLAVVSPGVVFSAAVLLAMRWRINVLSLGDMESKSLGISQAKNQAVLIGAATLMTASTTCISGTIGWIGLVIPHLGRLLFGPNHQYLLPGSCFLGGLFLLFVDNLARTMTAAEIPLGVLTGIIGTPVFAYMLLRRKLNWS